MARTTYLAPGVYVEEVPSAQQPIAGVGTNTAAFIGIVPDTIYYPVPNEDYDPVAAQAALELTALTARKAQLSSKEKPDAETVADVDNAIATSTRALQATIRRLDRNITLAQQELDKASDDAKPGIQARIDDLQKEKAMVQARLTPAEPAGKPDAGPKDNPGAASSAEKEETFEETIQDEAALLQKDPLKPYVMARFDVKVDACDAKLCTNFTEYTNRFGPFSAYKLSPEPGETNPAKWRFRPLHPGHSALTNAVNGFFTNGGTRVFVVRIKAVDTLEEDLKRALEELESIEEVALIAAPGLPKTLEVWEALSTWCDARENTFAILDSPGVVNDGKDEDLDIEQLVPGDSMKALPHFSKSAAYYFPHPEVTDPAKQLQDADPVRQVGLKYRGRTYVAPSGHIAGIYARTDEERGVHKAPANCPVRGALDVKYYIGKAKQELLNPHGVNCIRSLNGDIVVWGARTIGGDSNAEWKYVNVRRLFLFLRESIDKGTQWAVFEPNDYALWGKIRLNVSAFLTTVWRSGALFGLTPEEAFYVKCDSETNPPEERDLGKVVTEIGVAIVRPAEFVIFRVTQSTGMQKA